ncbi:CBU_0592 family membrane protein [Antarctobacter jejuensis]|uniref:CBU_0592 family membrane protein n=1 Tax=Antarctobacter jejuensis TaxID=1439938 RepID=UPI003FD31FD0
MASIIFFICDSLIGFSLRFRACREKSAKISPEARASEVLTLRRGVESGNKWRWTQLRVRFCTISARRARAYGAQRTKFFRAFMISLGCIVTGFPEMIVDHGTEIAGLAGAATYICNYLMLAMDRLTSRSPLYYLLQLTGASLVMVSLMTQFNMAAAIVQGFFVLVSLIGITRHLRPHRPAKTPSGVDGGPEKAL